MQPSGRLPWLLSSPACRRIEVPRAKGLGRQRTSESATTSPIFPPRGTPLPGFPTCGAHTRSRRAGARTARPCSPRSSPTQPSRPGTWCWPPAYRRHQGQLPPPGGHRRRDCVDPSAAGFVARAPPPGPQAGRPDRRGQRAGRPHRAAAGSSTRGDRPSSRRATVKTPSADRVADEERGGVSSSGESPRRLGRGLDTCPARSSRGTTRPAELRHSRYSTSGTPHPLIEEPTRYEEACRDRVRIPGDLFGVSTRARLLRRGALLDQRNPPSADRVADEERAAVSRSGEGSRGLGRGLDTCPAPSSRGTTRPAEPPIR